MAKKTYTPADRQAIREKLLTAGLEQFCKYGVRQVRLRDILAAAGISKPFFYTFFPSFGEFATKVLERQRELMLEIQAEQLGKKEVPFEEQVFVCLRTFLEKGCWAVNQEEGRYIYRQQAAGLHASFLAGNLEFYDTLLERFGVPAARLDRQIFGNAMQALLDHYFADPSGQVFYFQEKRQEAVLLQCKLLAAYVTSLRL